MNLNNKLSNTIKAKLQTTEAMFLDLHPAEEALTSNSTKLFQLQTWSINRAYIDDVICEAILNSLLKAPKDHIYKKWTTKVIECLSGYTIDSPWTQIAETIGLKKNDYKSHTLNLPVSRLIAKSIINTISSNPWNVNLALAITYIFSMKKTTNIVEALEGNFAAEIIEKAIEPFNKINIDNVGTEELIFAIAPEVVKSEGDQRLLFKNLQLLIESNWMLNDGIFMECFHSIESNNKAVKTAAKSSHSLAYIRNQATADLLR